MFALGSASDRHRIENENIFIFDFAFNLNSGISNKIIILIHRIIATVLKTEH